MVEAIGGLRRRRPRRLRTGDRERQNRWSPRTRLSWALHGEGLARRPPRPRASASPTEAAVAGGIPIIKGLRDGLAAQSRVDRVRDLSTAHLQLHPHRIKKICPRQRGARSSAKCWPDAQRSGLCRSDPQLRPSTRRCGPHQGDPAGPRLGSTDWPISDTLHVEGIRHVSALDIAFRRRTRLSDQAPGHRPLGWRRGWNSGSHSLHGARRAPDRDVRGRVQRRRRQGRLSWARSGCSVPGGARAEPASAIVADLVDLARGFGRADPGTREGPGAAWSPVPMDRRAGGALYT